MEKLRICFHTNTAWLNCITVKGSKTDDIQALIEEYIDENGTDWTSKYTYEDIYNDIFNPGMGREEFENILNEQYLPINGGEYYIYSIASIEEI